MTKRASGTNNSEENGFVAIVAAAFIIILVGLITIGFTRIMQREQRQALDRQLSRQALYAAESGINEVFANLVSGSSTFPEDKKNCDTEESGYEQLVNPQSLSDEFDVEYTCIQYDRTPGALSYELGNGESQLAILRTSNDSTFESVTVSWGNADETNNAVPSSCSDGNLFPGNNTTQVPVLKLDLTNTPGNPRRDFLIDNTEYLYLVPCPPSASTTVHDFIPDTRGDVVKVACNDSSPQPCSVTIDMTGYSSGRSSYMARIKPIYASSVVSITGRAGGSSAEFAFSQIEIDVTARANDIVRRLNAAIPYFSVEDVPESAVQSFSGVCKELSVIGTSQVIDGC